MTIFSGDYSRDMWAKINKAETVEDLQWALYFVCCRLQEFETEFEKLRPAQETSPAPGEAKWKRFCQRCERMGYATTPPGSDVWYCSTECAD